MTANGDVRDNDAVDGGMRIGLVAYGVVHLLVAYTALRLALGDQSTNASQQGALSQLAGSTAGRAGLVVLAVGFGALVVWQAVEVVRGRAGEHGLQQWWGRAISAGQGLVYLGLGLLSLRKALGGGGGGSTDSITAQVMAAPGGRYLVGAVGLAVVAIGVYLVFHGATGRFTDALDVEAHRGERKPLIVVLGIVGHLGKGAAVVAVGVLFVVAAAQFQPQQSGGLDQALHTLLRQPAGPYLVGAIGVGLAGFGLYCFAWARHHAG